MAKKTKIEALVRLHGQFAKWEKERQAHKKPVDMTISSRVPSKWRFVDLETGDIWKWDEKKGRFYASELE